MTILKDALAGIKQVLVMTADIERLADDMKGAQQDLRGLHDRVTRIEVMIEIAQRRTLPPEIQQR